MLGSASVRWWLAMVMLSACANVDDLGDIGVEESEVKVCAAGPTTKGIDVSHHQATIDWDKVKADGVVFAFIRVSDGLPPIDREFVRNWAEAKRVGIVRGVYQFFREDLDPVAQADVVLDEMGALDDGDLPPVIDVESTDGQTPATITANVGKWIDRIEAATGRRPIIYSGKYFWNDNVKSTAFSSYPLWIPQYGPVCPDLPTAWSEWAFFQYSSTGSVMGIGGNCDMNYFNGDRAALDGFIRASFLEPPPVVDPPTPPAPPDPPPPVVDEGDSFTEVDGGCQVAQGRNSGWGWLLAGLGLLLRRRQRSSQGVP
jgi:MYXO-CTERM domain-containing protein